VPTIAGVSATTELYAEITIGGKRTSVAALEGALLMEGSLLSPWFTRKHARLSGGGPDV